MNTNNSDNKTLADCVIGPMEWSKLPDAMKKQLDDYVEERILKYTKILIVLFTILSGILAYSANKAIASYAKDAVEKASNSEIANSVGKLLIENTSGSYVNFRKGLLVGMNDNIDRRITSLEEKTIYLDKFTKNISKESFMSLWTLRTVVQSTPTIKQGDWAKWIDDNAKLNNNSLIVRADLGLTASP